MVSPEWNEFKSQGISQIGRKKMINTVSSTEQELMGLDCELTKYFDLTNVYVYTDLVPYPERMKMYSDPDHAIAKSKDHKDCKNLTPVRKGARNRRKVTKL